jgi:PPOX class probable F420-dependent enzyme
MAPADLDLVRSIGAADHFLAVVATTRRDGSVQASVVNAGVLEHPVSGASTVGLVTYGPAKLANLRARPRASVVWRAGWQWVTVEGAAELAGPDDPLPGFDPNRVPQLLRDVFRAAGGTHDDWDTYDRIMREERRTAVLVAPERVYSNRPMPGVSG